MSVLGDIFKKENVGEQELQGLITQLKTNPMVAMATLQGMLPPDALQQVMAAVMQNPASVDELAAEIGVSQAEVDELKKSINPSL